MPKRKTSHGADTRDAILQTAADIASVDGLDGLSIGRLASDATRAGLRLLPADPHGG